MAMAGAPQVTGRADLQTDAFPRSTWGFPALWIDWGSQNRQICLFCDSPLKRRLFVVEQLVGFQPPVDVIGLLRQSLRIQQPWSTTYIRPSPQHLHVGTEGRQLGFWIPIERLHLKLRALQRGLTDLHTYSTDHEGSTAMVNG